MPKKQLNVDWKSEIGKEDLKPAVKRCRMYLVDHGLRASTIPMHVIHVTKYLMFSGTESPSADDLAGFRNQLHDKKLSRSTINNYCFSIRKYHEMLEQEKISRSSRQIFSIDLKKISNKIRKRICS